MLCTTTYFFNTTVKLLYYCLECEDYCILARLSHCHFFTILHLRCPTRKQSEKPDNPDNVASDCHFNQYETKRDHDRPIDWSCDILRKRHVVSFRMIHRCGQVIQRRLSLSESDTTFRFIISSIMTAPL